MKNVKVFLPIISSIVLVFLISIWIRANYFITVTGIHYSLVSSREINIENINSGKNYLLQKFESKNKEKRYFLRQKSFLAKSNRLELIGFEDKIEQCEQFKISLGDDFGDVLCFTGDVGAHSQNLVLLNIVNNHPKIINFDLNQTKQQNIYSDVPKIAFRDYDNDGLIDLIVENRDYEKDPVLTVVKDYYRNNGSEFVLDLEKSV